VLQDSLNENGNRLVRKRDYTSRIGLQFCGGEPESWLFMRRRIASFLILAPLLMAGCRDAKITSYKVPSEKPEPLPPILTGAVSPAASAPTSGSAMANTAVPTATGENLTWTAPEHWKAKAASAMRKGSYSVPGENGSEADLSITAFPGDVGGDAANFNRWRGQLDLPPLNDSELKEVITHLEQNGLTFSVAEFVNHKPEKGQRIIGALVPYNGATWFFKLMGPETLVAREKPAFFAFLQTVKAPAQSAQ
jgi:hypothetical protein